MHTFTHTHLLTRIFLGTIVPPRWKTGIFLSGAAMLLRTGPTWAAAVSTSYHGWVEASIVKRDDVCVCVSVSVCLCLCLSVCVSVSLCVLCVCVSV